MYFYHEAKNNKCNKYKSKKVQVDGITFDSKKESIRYKELKLLLQAGVISDLELQPVFELQPKFKKNGKTIRAIKYVADFMYYDNEKKKVVIEDTKGFETKDFKLKKKMFEYKYLDYELTIL